jgi:hypothetical protein
MPMAPAIAKMPLTWQVGPALATHIEDNPKAEITEMTLLILYSMN